MNCGNFLIFICLKRLFVSDNISHAIFQNLTISGSARVCVDLAQGAMETVNVTIKDCDIGKCGLNGKLCVQIYVLLHSSECQSWCVCTRLCLQCYYKVDSAHGSMEIVDVKQMRARDS